MQQTETDELIAKPLWKRILNFPLVALIVAVGLFILAFALGTQMGGTLPPMDADAELALRGGISIAVVWTVYKVAICRLGEEPRDDLKLADAPKGLGIGLLFGAILFSAVVGVAALADVYNIVGEGGTSELIKLAIAVAILPGFMEELLFRGILFRWLEELGGSWVALLLSSALFGLAHFYNPNATALSSVAIALSGVMLGGAYMLTRNLWMAIGLHAAWNFTQGWIFDVPVSGIDQDGMVQAQLSGPELLSGGAFGLEASLIAMVLATGAGVVLVVIAIKRGHVMQPWWVRRRLASERASQEAVRVDVDRDADLAAPV